MTKICDRYSVGVLITSQDRYLMFERATPPVGIAPVAGHVDDHGIPADAARAEVFEEVGLTVDSLSLVTSGWRPNRCRRPVPAGGLPGHYWTIFQAQVSGTLNSSAREARNARWLDRPEIQRLAARTVSYAYGAISAAEFSAAPGLEPVWLEWLHEAGIVEVTDDALTRVEDLAARPL
ncbi:NUDIX hydrolase [Streptosporangium jomthongense]|uniref:NUDIX hydrolase n=1 Tax=Streptosporangium jomthongense TaxID=1193683 RepID=A0ABV8F179_9ACTN